MSSQKIYIRSESVENRTENDSWHLSNINETLVQKAMDKGLNSELNSEIDLDSEYEADDGDFSATDVSDYADTITGQLENPVMANSTKILYNKRKRKWDRKNACCYCKQLVTNFSRHILRKHNNEHEVLLYASINDPNLKERKKRRQEITDKLRNRGNFLYNNSVANEDGKNIIPNRRIVKKATTAPSSPSSFVICKNCLGTFKRTTFFRHLRNCEGSNEERPLGTKKRVICCKSLPILPSLRGASEELQTIILPHLRNDDISDTVKNDYLILSFGTKLFKKKKERRSRKAICSKMRDLATLLQIVKYDSPEISTLDELLDPFKYELLINAIKKMCGFSNETGDVKITSIPARLRPSLLSCVDLLYTQIILDKSLSTSVKEHKKKKLDEFKLILEANWQWEISSNAEKARKKKMMIKEPVLPLDEDIEIIIKKIHELEEKYADELIKDVNIMNYENLCEVTIAHIIMLDRKRSGDVAEAELHYYVNRKTTEIPLSILKFLTPKQQDAMDKLDIFQIPGKRVRAVPVLLTHKMRENIDTIVTSRQQLNIPKTNPYLFARPLTDEPFDGGKCLNRIKEKCTLKKPEMVTATGMRHHIATMSQVHAGRNDKYTEHLAGFMGHDVNIHSQNYRLPLDALQKGIIGSRLIEMEESYKRTETNRDIDHVELETKVMIDDTCMHEEDENLRDDAVQSLKDVIIEETSNIKNIETNMNKIKTRQNTRKIIDYKSKDDSDYKENEIRKELEETNKNKIKTRQNTRKLIDCKSKADSDYKENEIRKELEETNKNKFKTRQSTRKLIDCKSKADSDYKENEIRKELEETNKNKIKTRQNTRKLIDSESDTDYDYDKNEIKKELKEISNINKTQRKKKIHLRWTNEELRIVRKRFQKELTQKRNPGKAKCSAVLREEPILHKRTWMQLNTCVNNMYVKGTGAKRSLRNKTY